MPYHTSLNLKSDEAYRLARELSERTGESMTKAVIAALRERLDRLKRDQTENRVQRLLAIGRDCAAHLGEAYRSLDHDALLYDEKTGLPRDC
ncbi:MAG TPA: type II toxin-antitoxin system VapB family antitoxin [Stellaceae bacterium]|nr:type II toxin-antitoxin system VapB family antitoxin [Stellaceae bacterium]